MVPQSRRTCESTSSGLRSLTPLPAFPFTSPQHLPSYCLNMSPTSPLPPAVPSQRNPTAFLNMGNIHDKGLGVPANVWDAAFWFRLAAKGGVVKAQALLLGLCLTDAEVAAIDRAIATTPNLRDFKGFPNGLPPEPVPAIEGVRALSEGERAAAAALGNSGLPGASGAWIAWSGGEEKSPLARLGVSAPGAGSPGLQAYESVQGPGGLLDDTESHGRLSGAEPPGSMGGMGMVGAAAAAGAPPSIPRLLASPSDPSAIGVLGRLAAGAPGAMTTGRSESVSGSPRGVPRAATGAAAGAAAGPANGSVAGAISSAGIDLHHRSRAPSSVGASEGASELVAGALLPEGAAAAVGSNASHPSLAGSSSPSVHSDIRAPKPQSPFAVAVGGVGPLIAPSQDGSSPISSERALDQQRQKAKREARDLMRKEGMVFIENEDWNGLRRWAFAIPEGSKADFVDLRLEVNAEQKGWREGMLALYDSLRELDKLPSQWKPDTLCNWFALCVPSLHPYSKEIEATLRGLGKDLKLRALLDEEDLGRRFGSIADKYSTLGGLFREAARALVDRDREQSSIKIKVGASGEVRKRHDPSFKRLRCAQMLSQLLSNLTSLISSFLPFLPSTARASHLTAARRARHLSRGRDRRRPSPPCPGRGQARQQAHSLCCEDLPSRECRPLGEDEGSLRQAHGHQRRVYAAVVS